MSNTTQSPSEFFTQIVKRFPLKQFMVNAKIDESALLHSQMKAEYMLSDMFQGMICTLKATLATGRETEEITKTIPGFVHHTCPTTPWQHFKLTYAPAWFTRAWPVRMDQVSIPYTKTVHSIITRVCPHLDYDPAVDHITFLDSKRGSPFNGR